MDRRFFEQMAMPLFDQLYNHAHWLAGDRADAEDLVQETYAKALKGFTSFAEGTNLRAWMFRILRNTFLTSRSGLAARRTEALEDDERPGETASDPATPETAVLLLESRQQIFAALDAIPANHREIILLSDVEEMSYREISLVLDVPLGTVMSRLARARAALRRALAGHAKQEVH
jgi:RNA polymerase sigma-70 factor (ECF subfamily)